MKVAESASDLWRRFAVVEKKKFIIRVVPRYWIG